MFTMEYWKAVLERMISTFAETFLATGIVGVGVSATQNDWKYAAYTALLATLFAFLKSLIASRVGDNGPGFGSVEQLRQPDNKG